MESISSEMKASRKFKRKAYGQMVIFYVNGTEHRGLSADLGAGGMFVQTRGIFAVGSDITLKLSLKSSREKEAVLHGRITRVAREGIGIEFVR